MKRTFILPGILLVLAGPAAAQGPKTIKEKKIASLTVYEYFIEEGMDEPVVESVERFNDNGERVELKEMNKKGEVTRWEKYAFDEQGNLVEEQFLDGKGRVDRTEKNIYENGLRIEKQYYNTRNQMYKKKEYKYEYRE